VTGPSAGREQTPVLEAVDVSVSFGGVTAVDRVGLRVEPGEVVGLVGPNGSGKTTFLNALTGIVPASGAVAVAGRPLALGSPGRARRAGVLRVFQAPQTFDELSCLENVLVSQPNRAFTGLTAACFARPLVLRRERARWAAAEEVLVRVGLDGVATTPAGSLSYGGRRLLELARALYAEPRLLLLDEPSAGLNDAETADLSTVIEGLADGELATVLVDHKVHLIDALCSRVVVLEMGRLIAEGGPADVWRDQRVVDAYLGVVENA
jgi:ABC-type branched-subunit amino acid transport system ATPase component